MTTTKTKILTLSLLGVSVLGSVGYLATGSFSAGDLPGGWTTAPETNELILGEVPLNASVTLKQINFVPETVQVGQSASNATVHWQMTDKGLVSSSLAQPKATNITTGNASIFGGERNKALSANSLILGGKDNVVAEGAAGSIITASENISALATGSITFASKGSRIAGRDSSIWASTNSAIEAGAENSTIVAGENIKILKSNSMAIGRNINVNHAGSFVFNGKTQTVATKTGHSVLISADNGMIINTNKAQPGIGLTVNGGIQVGNQKSAGFDAIVITGSTACLSLRSLDTPSQGMISVNPSCLTESSVPAGEYPQCGINAGVYEATATNWRNNSDSGFCARGNVVNKPTAFFSKPSCNKCALRGFNYCFDVSFDPNSDACKLGNDAIKWQCKTPLGSITCMATQKLEKLPEATPDKGVCGDEKYTCKSGKSGNQKENPDSRTWTCAGKDGGVSCQILKQTYSCTGTPKPNSTLIAGDDQGLTQNTAITLVETNSSAKCEYKCNDGYSLHNGNCAKLEDTNTVCPAPVIDKVADDKIYFSNVDTSIVNAIAISQGATLSLPNPSYHGSQISPRELPNKTLTEGYVQLTAYCKSGTATSQPFPYSKIKRCNEVKIDNVSCKYNQIKQKTEWRIDYTYRNCDGMGSVYGASDNNFKNNLSIFAGPGFNPQGDSHTVNTDGSITAKKYLTVPASFGGPETWFFKIDNSPVFQINRRTIYNTNKCYAPSTIKVDWEGNPFEWEQNAVYDSKRNKITITQVGVFTPEPWRPTNTLPGPTHRAEYRTFSGVPTWISPSKIGLFPRLNDGSYYIAGHSNNWHKFTVQNTNITVITNPTSIDGNQSIPISSVVSTQEYIALLHKTK